MITYIFAATKSELLISGQIGYEREKGTGTEEDPFLIYTIGSSSGNAEQGSFNFYAGKNAEGKNYFASTSPQYYFKQANDLAGSNFTQTTLNGFYDGNNYEFDASGAGAIFQGVGDEVKAELRDLTVRNINSTDTAGVAGYVGSDGVIDSVTFTGSINYSGTATYVAGITTGSMGGTIKNCVNYANIVGTREVAGIIADFDTASIENCRNFGNVTSTTSGGYAGGIVGYGMYQYIKNSYNTGKITGDNAGGIAGLLCNGTSVIDSYNTGEVQGTTNAGGVVGIIDEYGATITNCYNSGKIASGSGYVGGIVGNHNVGAHTIEKCYNLGTLETTGTKGGILGYDKPCSAMITSCYSVKSSNEMTGIGGFGGIAPVGTTLMPEAMKSLTQLQTQSTYSNWTFGTYGSAMPSATAPTRSGYTFGGYYTGTNGTGTQHYTASMASARTWNLTSNTTLYAKWIAPNFTVTFDANGGTIGGYTVESVSGATYGFELNSGGYYESQNKKVPNSAALYKVSFYATAGSTVVFEVINYAESSFDYGLLGTLDGTAMSTSYSDTSTGVVKSFSGSQSSSTQTYSYSISSTGNHYVYVKYRKDGSVDKDNDSFQFRISSGVGGGSTTTSLTVSAGGTISTLPVASRSGYTFDGWYTSTSGGTKLTTSTSITSSKTYYAHWSSSSGGSSGSGSIGGNIGIYDVHVVLGEGGEEVESTVFQTNSSGRLDTHWDFQACTSGSGGSTVVIDWAEDIYHGNDDFEISYLLVNGEEVTYGYADVSVDAGVSAGVQTFLFDFLIDIDVYNARADIYVIIGPSSDFDDIGILEDYLGYSIDEGYSECPSCNGEDGNWLCSNCGWCDVCSNDPHCDECGWCTSCGHDSSCSYG